MILFKNGEGKSKKKKFTQKLVFSVSLCLFFADMLFIQSLANIFGIFIIVPGIIFYLIGSSFKCNFKMPTNPINCNLAYITSVLISMIIFYIIGWLFALVISKIVVRNK